MPLPSSPHVIITGAGNGFGRALALVLAERRARLLVSDKNEASARETADLALAKGAKLATHVGCDVSRPEDLDTLALAATSSGNGPIDLVVNNAGVSSAGRIGESPLDDWRWTIDIDLFGVIYGCHTFVPILRRQGHGHILNMASAAGLVATPGMGAYNVAKAGVVALSETLSAELVGTRIGVTVLCPTFFQTDIVNSGRFADPKLRASGEKLIARGQTADRVARAALASVETNQLYSVPMPDGLWAWRAKRAAPQMFTRLLTRLAARATSRR